MLKTLRVCSLSPRWSTISFSQRRFSTNQLYVTEPELSLGEFFKSEGAYINGAIIGWKRRTKKAFQTDDFKNEVEIVRAQTYDTEYLSKRMRRGLFASKFS